MKTLLITPKPTMLNATQKAIAAAKAASPLSLVLNVNQIFYLKHAIDNADFSDMPDELGEPFSPYILMRLQGKIDDLYERALDLRAHSDQIIAAITAAQQ